MKWTILTAAAAGLAVSMTVPLAAQTAPRTFTIDQIRASCVRQYSDPTNCNRTADVARSRYGNSLTMLQWNAAAGVVRHMHRQGKFARQ